MAEREGQIVKQLHAIYRLRQILNLQNLIPDLPLRPEVDVRILPRAWPDIVKLNLLQCPLPRGGLLGLGRIRRETLDEFLQLLDLLFLLLVGLLHLTDAQLGRLVPEVIVARIELNLSIVNIRNIRADLVQKIPVVADHDDRILKVDQKLLKPADRVQIQMVCRLIQKQDVRIAEQGSCQKDLDLLGAGQLLHQYLVKFCRNSQPVQEGLRVGLRLPAVHLGKFRLELRCPHAVLIREIRLRVEGILLFADLIQPSVALDDRVKHSLIIILKMILLEERQSLSRCDGDTSGRRLQLSGQYLQKCGLACPIRANDAIAVAFGEFDVDIFEQCSLSETQRDIICSYHVSESS